MNVTKRLLSLLLAVIMVLSMVPAVSAAEEANTQAATDIASYPETYDLIEIGSQTDWDYWFKGNANILKQAAKNKDAEGNYKPQVVKITDSFTIENNDNLYYGSRSDENGAFNIYIDMQGNTITYASCVNNSLEGEEPARSSLKFFSSYDIDSTITFVGGKIVSTAAVVSANGAIFFMNRGTLILKDMEIVDNNTAAYWAAGKVMSIGKEATLKMDNTTITSNTENTAEASFTSKNEDTAEYVTKSSVPLGGALYITGKAEITNSSISASTTSGVETGGLICVDSGGSLTAEGTTFTGGAATYRGGSIAVVSSSTLTLTDCTVSGGTVAATGSKYDAMGGNIFTLGSTAKLTDCTVTGGKVSSTDTAVAAYGGNICVRGGTFEIDGGAVTNGIARGRKIDAGTTSGGNIHVAEGGKVTSNCTISGGKIYCDITHSSSTKQYPTGGNVGIGGAKDLTGFFIMEGGSVTGGQTLNGKDPTTGKTGTASQRRGGNVGMHGYSVFIMNGGTISGGSAARGTQVDLWATNNVMVLNGGTITGKKTTAVDMQLTGTLIMKGGLLDEVVVGLGSTATSYFRMYGGTIKSSKTYTETMKYTMHSDGYYACTAYFYSGQTSFAVENLTGISNAAGTATKMYMGVPTACSEIIAPAEGEEYYTIRHKDTSNTVTADPTCEAAGTKTITCTTCDFTRYNQKFDGVYTYETEAALGHDIVSHEAQAPTCNDIGWNAYEACSRCDYTTYEELAAAGHSYGAVVTAPSCEDQGYTTYTCSACGDSYVDDYTAQTGHAWDAGVIDPAPTCNNAGTKTYTCGNCGGTKTEVVDATGHTPVVDAAKEATCTETGLTEGSHCDVCGETIVAQEVIPVKPHTAGDVVVENNVEPTCEAGGSYDNVTYCTACGAETSRETVSVEAKGHAWDAGVYTEPTFEADGYTTYTCGTCGATKTEIKEGTQLQKVKPNAIVTELEKQTLAAGEYTIYTGNIQESTEDLPLEVVVNFKAEDDEAACIAGGYSDWLVDFNLTFTGMANGENMSTVGCYLAGNYGEFGWIAIPADAMLAELQNGVTYPVVSNVLSLTYYDICSSVKDFTAALHIDQAILDANPDLVVTLELVMTNPDDATDTMKIDEPVVYTAADLKNEEEKVLPQAQVTPMGKVTLEDGGYRVWNGIVSDKESEALVDGEGELPLEIVVNFKAIDTLEECLAGGYAKWLVDFNITVSGLANGSFVGDNCYLAGNYGSYGWIKIPLDGQTISEGVTYPVVALYDPTLNYKDICKSVKDFTAAIHIDQAILDANPDLEIKLELVMTNPDDATDTVQIGEDLIYTFDELSSGIVAQNVQTGVVYSNVATALTEAEAGQTVILLADCESTEVLLAAGKTLDLNGYTLTSGLVAAPYANTYVIDSTDGKGLLVTDRDSLAVLTEHSYLPVWVGDGYRFVSVSMRQSLKRKDNGDAYLRFFIEGDDATCALQQALADGGADNGVSICVKLNWIDKNGNEGTKSFVFSEEMVKDYAADWTGNEFRLTVSGMENVTQLSLTPQVMAEANATSVVVISGATLTENG